MKYDKLNFDSLKSLLAGMCSLSPDEINSLEKKCFDFAITTTRPNNEVTFLLLEKSYMTLATRKATYAQIMNNFEYWMMMPL